jgi:acyl-CoA dehydrogenase
MRGWSAESPGSPAAPADGEVGALRDEVRRFLAGQTFTARCDSWMTGFSEEFSKRLGDRGWIGMTWPSEFGGGERPTWQRHVVSEELLAAGAPVAAHWFADRQTGPQLLRFGSDAQRRRFLPRIAAGECFFCVGMSEPDAGSDLAALRTAARPVAGGWSVSGTKLWTSHAHRAHYMVALVRTSTESDRHAGLSQVIIDLSHPGVGVNPVRTVTGAAHFNEVALDEVFVRADMVIGTVGAGWSQILSELTSERSGPERVLSTFPLLAAAFGSAGPDVDDRQAELIGRAVARYQTLRRMSASVTLAAQAGRDVARSAALVKWLGTSFEQDTVEVARAFAPRARGERVEALLGEAALAAPGFTLRGGTSEVLMGIVARGLGS